MDISASSVVLALVLALLSALIPQLVNRRVGPLETERGRRLARQRIKKSYAHYDALGVLSVEDYFVNSRGVEVFTKQWLPKDKQVRALVLYCHGYGDTVTYFWDESATRLAQGHYLVVGMDHEGFGLSSGLHGYIPNFDTLVDDIIELADKLKARPETGYLPFILFGESMGGAIAIKASLKRPDLWRGAVLLAPMVKIDEAFYPPPHVVFVLHLLSRIVPKWQLVPSGRDIAEAGFRDPPKRHLASINPVAYAERARLKTAFELLRVVDDIQGSLSEISLPVLILHGTNDSITSCSMSQTLYDSVSSTDKSLKLYEGSWHGLLVGEPDEVQEQVLKDVLSWLDAHSDKSLHALAGPLSVVGLSPGDNNISRALSAVPSS